MRPERPFRELLQEALAAAREGDLEALREKSFRREAQRHAQLAQKGDDPVASALALGRQALWDLAQGNGEGACQKLSEALEMHPFLGGGLAWELARVLCGRVGDAVSPPLGERRVLMRELPPAARLLAFLDQVPPGFWAEALRGRGGAASRTASSPGDRHQLRPRAGSPRDGERPPLPRRPDRPRLPLVYQPLRRKGPQGKGETGRQSLASISLGLLPQKSDSGWWKPPGARSLRRWVAPGLEVREREDGGLRLRVLPEFWEAYPEAALLVLEAKGARALAFLLPTERPLPLPVDFEEEAELVAEVWSWGDLTPEALTGLFQGARFHLDLFRTWLWYGTTRGLISREAVWEALRRLG